ncbi:acetaldehyde dehydrogenase family protein [Leeia aquatica]|uniref:Acetaldehyde dehydrogenase family protein n=1 Tax=Leeia aquatica TaxID=2725557 RepID=A0A847S409_9NEIS|nr:acetaldehyde dehydrogenase family protein [Leeia aquatica]NLR76481.1 acetaldehyde dehydrogenase family protein [Leeia aquatica]
MTAATAACLEQVWFRTHPDVDADTVLAAVHAMQADVARLPGFRHRQLARAEDGRWLDSILWQDAASAQAAMQAVMQLPSCGAFFALIEADSIDMQHLQSHPL